jgi:hypothetical protein
MTRTTNARIAGFTFIFYIVAGLVAMNLTGMTTGGEGTAARLGNLTAHTKEYGIALILDFWCNFSALTLAVTLYAFTRDQNRGLALLGFELALAVLFIIKGVPGKTYSYFQNRFNHLK